MEIYSIQIPPFAPATFHKENGVYYHTQDPEHPKQLSSCYWNPNKKSFDWVEDKATWTIVCPLIMCTEESFASYIEHELPSLKEIAEDPSGNKNIFICHSDLRKNPIYVGFFIEEGIGEDLW